MPELRKLNYLRCFYILALSLGLSLAGFFPKSGMASESDRRQRGFLKSLYQRVGINENKYFNHPLGIFYYFPKQELYLLDTDNHSVAIFNPDGLYLREWIPSSPLHFPLALAINEEGLIFLTQQGDTKISVFTLEGKYLYSISPPDEIAGHFLPGQLSLDNDRGRLYVINKKEGQILAFNQQGEYLFTFGGKGNGPGLFRSIMDITTDREGRLYVSDLSNHPIQVFDQKGIFLFTIGSFGRMDNEFSFPNGLAIDQKNRLWVIDSMAHQLKIFDENKKLIFVGGKYGHEEGDFIFPVDISLNQEGRCYIVEKGGNRFQAFKIKDQ